MKLPGLTDGCGKISYSEMRVGMISFLETCCQNDDVLGCPAQEGSQGWLWLTPLAMVDD